MVPAARAVLERRCEIAERHLDVVDGFVPRVIAVAVAALAVPAALRIGGQPLFAVSVSTPA